MPTVDREEIARLQLGNAFARSTREHEAALMTCIEAGRERGEPIPREARVMLKVEEDGEARPVSLRMIGPHKTALQDCFWREVSRWRYQGLVPIRLDVEATMRLVPREETASDAVEAQPPMTPDRSQGRVSLVTAEAAFGEIWAHWYEPVSLWSEDLGGCFDQAWVSAGWECAGPLEMPLEVSADGLASMIEAPRWVVDLAAAAPLQEKEATPSPAPETAGGEPTPTAPYPPYALAPRCPARVALCLADSVTIWQLEPASIGGQIVLQLMVEPPHRLEDAAPPGMWPSTQFTPAEAGLMRWDSQTDPTPTAPAPSDR